MTTAAYQYSLFGITPWSNQLVLLLIFSNLQNLLVSTGMGWTMITWLLKKSSETSEADLNTEMLKTGYRGRSYTQDTLADTLGFVLMPLLLQIIPKYVLPSVYSRWGETFAQRFTEDYFVSRLLLMFGMKLVFWCIGYALFLREIKPVKTR